MGILVPVIGSCNHHGSQSENSVVKTNRPPVVQRSFQTPQNSMEPVTLFAYTAVPGGLNVLKRVVILEQNFNFSVEQHVHVTTHTAHSAEPTGEKEHGI